MGCDIHLYQEKRVNGKWITADKWTPSPYEDEHGKLRVTYEDRLYTDRNYDLFAVLANVRNGRGFAGIVTGSRIVPISAPRGVPEDACMEYLWEVDDWGIDGHSHSWLTLADLDTYDWTAAHQNRGVLPLREYRRWKSSGDAEPRTWCGSVTGPGISIINEESARGLSDKVVDLNDRIYVEAWWPSSVGSDCKEFLDVVRPRLLELERECGKGNARLVFFFDN